MRYFTCRDCNESLPEDAFYPNRSATASRPVTYYCKPCFKARNRKDYAAKKSDPEFLETRRKQLRESRKNKPQYKKLSDDPEYQRYKAYFQDAKTRDTSALPIPKLICDKPKTQPAYKRDFSRACQEKGLDRDLLWPLYLETQGICELCYKREAHCRLAIDHCHETGQFRGFLCHTCNPGLGQLGDTVESLTRALEYLKKR